MSVLEILVGAKALLEARGWMKGMPDVCSGPLCMGVALARIASSSEHNAAYHRLLDEIRSTGWSRTTSVITWNDEHERTQDQVFKVFDGAIARERARAEA